MKQIFRHQTYEGLYFRREVSTGRPQDAERADILDVLVENRYEPSISDLPADSEQRQTGQAKSFLGHAGHR